MKAEATTWSQPLKQKGIDPAGMRDAEQLVRELESQTVAQALAVKLAEGEVYDLTFQAEDCRNVFVDVRFDASVYVAAKQLFVEDVSGTLYPIKGARKHLATLFSAWKPAGRGRAAATSS